MKTPIKFTPKTLESWLEYFDMSEHELAELLGVTKPAVDHWLTGRREVPPTVQKLLNYFLSHPDRLGEF